MNNLFNKELQIVNLGLKSFNEALEHHKVKYRQVDWRPSLETLKEFSKVIKDNQEKISKANQQAISKVLAAKPFLVGLAKAQDVIPRMKKNLILHAGPPIKWKNMCGPMQGAIIGALLYEGLADNKKEANEMALSGEIEFSPAHHHRSVGPMAGIISTSMPVFIIENKEHGNRAFCTMNEGLGKVLRYGAYDESVIKRLKWMDQVLYPTLKKAMESQKEIDLKSIMANALHMGDEIHNRNRAATSLFFRSLCKNIFKKAKNSDEAYQVLDFINGNDHFFLNLSMAASKATMDVAANIKYSSLVTIMSRNGSEFGVALAGVKNRWFVGEAEVPKALFFPGYSYKDANPDIGDSSITETNSLGGLAIAASPAIVQFVGGSSNEAINYTREMYEITMRENNIFQIPYLNFRGTPSGIDVIKVIDKNILPFIDTGVAHKKAGIGQVGAGVLRAPVKPFIKAYQGLAEEILKDT